MTKPSLTSFSTRVTPEMASQLQREAKSRGLTVDNLLASYAFHGLARDALNPDELDRIRRRHADVLYLHKSDRDDSCRECGAPHPCSTYLVLTEEPDEYELRKSMR